MVISWSAKWMAFVPPFRRMPLADLIFFEGEFVRLSDNKQPKTLTTSGGAPVAGNQNSLTAGPRGPLLLQDYQLIEKLAHQNRERIPERPVHAKGWGAYGTFTVTHDITKYTKAKLFSEIGKQTEVIVRFSTVAGELGAAD